MSTNQDSNAALPSDAQPSVVRNFYMFLAGPEYFSALDATASTLPPGLQPILAAFRQNLTGVISTVSLPAALAGASAQRHVYQHLHFVETLRQRAKWIGEGGSVSGPLPEAYAVRAAERARDQLGDEGTARDRVVDSAFGLLQRTLASADVLEAAQELLRQGLLLTWGAFEVLARETFSHYLNQRPIEIKTLLQHPDARRLIQLRGLDFDVLAEHGFDISESLGDIVASQTDLSRLSAIKEFLSVLFPTDEVLRKGLSHRDLWLLNQRRHLIVHQRGLVDQRFLEKTGVAGRLGERLVVTPTELHGCLELVRDTGVQLLSTAGRHLIGV